MPSLLHVEPVQRYLSELFLCSVPEREGCVALTFDDGPNPRNTPELLDILARKNVPATFFVLGRQVRRHPEIARRTHEEGHELANHTDSHWPLPLLPRRLVRREVLRAEHAIRAITGEKPRFLRPPMGWFSHRTLDHLDELGYVPVIGSVHPRDSRQPPVDVILDRVRPRLTDGAILIFHDGGWRDGVSRANTLEAVDRLTDELLADGVRFLTVGQMTESPDPTADTTPDAN